VTVLDFLPPTLHALSPEVDVEAEPAAPALLLTGERAFWLATARRFVLDTLLRADVDDDSTGDTLVMLEDVVVEVLHQTGARSVTVAVQVDAETVQVEVRERGSVAGFRTDGVATLDRMADQWGVSRRQSSTGLWFRVARWQDVTEERFSA
jgi:hypothetical protein